MNIQTVVWESTPELENCENCTIIYNCPQAVKEAISEKEDTRDVFVWEKGIRRKSQTKQIEKLLKDFLEKGKNELFQTFMNIFNSSTDYLLWKATRNLKNNMKTIPHIKKINRS